MFHRIYESMELGMHPASLYPRRNRVAPTSENRQERTASSKISVADTNPDCTAIAEGGQIAVPAGFAAGIIGPVSVQMSPADLPHDLTDCGAHRRGVESVTANCPILCPAAAS